eukprot:Gb_17409 [translate_table: standard]
MDHPSNRSSPVPLLHRRAIPPKPPYQNVPSALQGCERASEQGGPLNFVPIRVSGTLASASGFQRQSFISGECPSHWEGKANPYGVGRPLESLHYYRPPKNKNEVTIGHGMDSSIDESDLGSLDVPVTGRRTSRRSRGMRVCLLLAAFLVHPALRSPLTDEVADRYFQEIDRGAQDPLFIHIVGTGIASPKRCKLRVDQCEALASLPARAPSRRPATPANSSSADHRYQLLIDSGGRAGNGFARPYWR